MGGERRGGKRGERRIAIPPHQSKRERAPSLGNHERRLWQRAEGRPLARQRGYAEIGGGCFKGREGLVEGKM